MADAEIIPLGTRGTPGRGTGSSKPSSRQLAAWPPGRRASPRRPAAGRSGAGPRRRSPRRAPGAADPGPARRRPSRCARSTADRPPGTAEHRTRGRASRAVDWLAGFTTAAVEVFGDDWEPRLAEFLAFLRRRVTGDYEVDEYGFDTEITEPFFLAALRPLAEKWFRIEVRGVENIPADGGALVVSNHSGTVPVDGLMTAVASTTTPAATCARSAPTWSSGCRSSASWPARAAPPWPATRTPSGCSRGGELVGVWPEGFKGIGKPYSERYKLQRFGRGGFVSAAIRTGVPIVPCSVVGAEEIYPLVGNIPSLARLLGVPYIPITPFFPLARPARA